MRSSGRVAAFAAPALLRALAASWRVVETDEMGQTGPARRRLEPAIYALWHAELLPLMMIYAPLGPATMISHHGDGEIAAAVVRSLGSRVVRGSSTAGGGEAFRELVQLGRDGRAIAMTPDGPRGPAGRCKPGVLRLAARSGLPVAPVAARPASGWRARSWDRFIVPKPFTVVHVEFTPPIDVPSDLAGADVPAWLDRLDRAITAASERCRRRAAGEERPARGDGPAGVGG